MSIKKRILGASVAIMLFAGCVGCGGGGGASTGSEPNSGGADLTTTSIYINSQSGNDKNDGTTPERALKSLDSMSYRDVLPGTTIYLTGKFEGVLSFNGSGTQEEPITITSYGDQRAVIDGNGAATAISISDQNWITIDNLEITLTAKPDELARNAIFFSATGGVMQGLTVKNCYIHDVVGTKLGQFAAGDYYNSYYASSAIGFRYLLEDTDEQNKFDTVTISNCVIENIIGCGIRFHDINKYADYRGENPYFSNIIIEDTTIDTTAGDGIILQCCNAPIVRRCKVFRVGVLDDKSTQNFHCAVWACATRSPLYEYNEIAYTKYVCGDGQAFDTDWGSSGTAIFQYNYTHDNEGGVLLRHMDYKAIYRYNISVNDGVIKKDDGSYGKRALFFHSSPHEAVKETMYCYNNIFLNNVCDTYIAQAYDPYPYAKSYDTSTNVFKNNVFVSLNNPWWGTVTVLDGNCYFRLNGETTAPARDTNGYAGDPMFASTITQAPASFSDAVSAFALQSSSPLLGKGVALTEEELFLFCGKNILGEIAGSNIGPY